MAIQQIVGSLTYARNAGADLSSSLNLLAHVDTDGDIVLAGAGDVALGSLIEAAAQDKPVTVQIGGIMKVVAGAAVTAGVGVKPDGSGKGIAGTSAGDVNIGICLDTVDAADKVMSVVYYPHTIHA